MKHIFYVCACTATLLLGMVLFLYLDSKIILNYPKYHTSESINKKNTTSKTVTLYSCFSEKAKQEQTDIIYSNSTAENIQLLLNCWLNFFDEEHITHKDTQVSSVCLSSSKQEAFISLNQYPFEKNWSTYQKLMWVESLLKTLRENKIPITSIRLLHHHQPLVDSHLNFDISWPITGFTTN